MLDRQLNQLRKSQEIALEESNKMLEQQFAIQTQLADIQNLGSNGNITADIDSVVDPRFLLKPQDLAERQYIEANRQLNEYYQTMQKCFNEAFLFASAISSGGIAIEEQSKIASYFATFSEITGDIPFSSLVLSSLSSAFSAVAAAKTRGNYSNFSDLNPNSDPISSSLLSEELARRFTISRELAENTQSHITNNNQALTQKTWMQEFQTSIKQQTREFLKNFRGNLDIGFLGKERTEVEILAISDFDAAVRFIFEKGVASETKSIADEKERIKAVAVIIVENSLEIMAKQYEDSTLGTSLGSCFDGIYSGSFENRITEIRLDINQAQQTLPNHTTNPTQTISGYQTGQIIEVMQKIRQEFELRLQQQGQETRQEFELRLQKEQERLQQQNQEIQKLKQENKKLSERLENQWKQIEQSQSETHTLNANNRQLISKIIEESQKMNSDRQKIESLARIADIAPDLEINIGSGIQQRATKLGDIFKNKQRQQWGFEAKLDEIMPQILAKLEEQNDRIDRVEEQSRKKLANQRSEKRISATCISGISTNCQIM